MEFEHNDERDQFLKARGKIVLNACPGSGKTTTIAYKLTQITQEFEEKYGRFSGIACLSFTNVAKDEINEKYKQFSDKFLGFPHLVSTIDSFINSYITTPFIHLVVEFNKKPIIIDDSDIINKAIGDSWWFYMNKEQAKYIYKYNPSTIEYDIKGTAYPFKGNDRSITCLEYCKKVKEAQKKLGLLKSTDSEFYALKILNEYPRIGKWLVGRFPSIIIDEAQDTSEIQHAIFDKLIKLGLENIEFIGDPYQSLYEWRDARPDLFYVKYMDHRNWTPLSLSNCKRSVQLIVDCYSLIRLANEPNINSTVNFESETSITVIRFKKDLEQLCAKKFAELCNDDENNQIVVRGKALRNKLLGITGEDEYPWKEPLPYYVVRAKQYLLQNDVKTAVNRFRLAIPLIENPKIEYHERKERERKLREDYFWNSKILEVLKAIPNFEKTLEEWTTNVQKLLKETFQVGHDIDFGLKKGIWNNRYGLPIKKLFGVPQPLTAIHISTIHQIKGMTVDSLLLILNATSKGQSISLSDYYTPNDFPDEKQRMIYVAMSRPRKFLAIGIPKGKHTNEEIQKILKCEVNFLEV